MGMLESIAGLPLGKGTTHIAVIAAADVTEAKLCEGMTVFWRGDRPIGHVLVHEGKTNGSSIEHIDAGFLRAIDDGSRRSVQPALSASVVICTRDRPEELSVCLSSLPRQSYQPREIIVVDNASRDPRT